MAIKAKLKTKCCKVCGGEFETYDSFRKWCSPDCGVKLAKEQQAKQRAKAAAKREKEERAKIRQAQVNLRKDDRRYWLKKAQDEFNKFIRLRDRDLPCISCGRFHQGKWDAGHYRTVGSSPELRFNEDNCHKQCVPCNQHRHGNAIEYRIGLIERIGLDRVEFLERKDHPPLKLTEDEIKDLIKVYKAKCKELENGV